MYLLTLVFLSAALGYLLADGSFGRRTSAGPRRPARWGDAVETRWKALFNRTASADAFRTWATGPGAALFPLDFRRWLSDLSDDESRHFSRALEEYANSLGFNLNHLVSGGLDDEPIMRQVFVEAVVVYSPAYRKVRQAQLEAEKRAAERAADDAAQPAPDAKKQPAQKSLSRRRRNGDNDTTEVAAAD